MYTITNTDAPDVVVHRRTAQSEGIWTERERTNVQDQAIDIRNEGRSQTPYQHFVNLQANASRRTSIGGWETGGWANGTSETTARWVPCLAAR